MSKLDNLDSVARVARERGNPATVRPDTLLRLVDIGRAAQEVDEFIPDNEHLTAPLAEKRSKLRAALDALETDDGE